MQCSVCKLSDSAVTGHPPSLGDDGKLVCPRCGTYLIAFRAAAVLEQRPPDYRLSAWLRSRAGGDTLPLVTLDTLEFSTTLPKYTVTERQNIFLRAIESKTTLAGSSVHIVQEYDFTLAYCSSAQELNFIIRSLMARDLLSLGTYSDPKDSFSIELSITPRGWQHLDEHAKPVLFSNQGFVAMAFAEEMRPAWIDGIAPALKESGYKPYRVDAQPHTDRIDVKIMAEIKNSRFLVADVTRQRPGVYFEAGYALGLGLPVFWTVREDDKDNIHFDTRQYNHIVWSSVPHLREQLNWFLLAVLGRGTAA